MATASPSSKSKNVVVVPWPDLPDCLAEEILERLPVLDYVRFGAVCRRWRSIQTTHRLRHAPAPPPTVNLPWFVPDMPNQESVLCSVGLEDLNDRRSQRRHHIPISPRYLQCLQEATEVGEGHFLRTASLSLPSGWLLFDDCPFLNSCCRFTLLNPVTGAQVQLPSIGSFYNDFTATMSPPPCCDVLVVTSVIWGIKLHLYRQGSPCWTCVHYCRKAFNDEVLMRLASAMYYEGKFYCLFLGQGLMVVDVDPRIKDDDIKGLYLEMDQSHLPPFVLLDEEDEDIVPDMLDIFLVESNGKMLLVSKFVESNPPSAAQPPLVRFELCEADLSNRRWVKVESLGDRSLFVYRDFVVSLLAADVGVKENCIYFLDQHTDEPTPWSVFDFGTGKVTDASLPCPPLPSTHLMFVPSIY